MSQKALAIIILSFYLIFSLSCAHQGSSKSFRQGATPVDPNDKVSWWQKEENQWLFSALLILGVGVATSASMIIIFNSGGLFIRVKK